MIFYVVTRSQRRLVDRFLEGRGRALVGKLRPVSYEGLLRRRRLPVGHYVFADLERLSPRQAEGAARVWELLASSSSGGRLFNHPTRVLRRYELLRRLRESGVNESGAYRLTEAREPERYPVFMRRENDHAGSRTPLLRTPEELRRAIEELDRAGWSREDAIVCEFCDTADAAGVYRKYAAFLVNGRILPRHVFFSKHWVVKDADRIDEAGLRIEQEYLAENPHEAELRRVFELARIDYGRIDYSLRGSGIEVWEINTHPTLPTIPGAGGPAREAINAGFTRGLVAALEEIAAEPVAAGRGVPTGLPAFPAAKALSRRVRRGLRRGRRAIAARFGRRGPPEGGSATREAPGGPAESR